MGQKTHPLGFRLGITQEHKSLWYATFNDYSGILKEDDKIRTYLNKTDKKYGIADVFINRSGCNDHIEVNLETGSPGKVVGEEAVEFKNLISNVDNLLPVNQKLDMNVFEVEFADLNAGLLADSIVSQLEKRVAFRRAIREALLRSQKQKVLGIKIQVSGRLNGAEIARSEWIREGRVPLQTLRANIEYATREAHTIYGVIGVKVWIFKGEIFLK